MLYGQYTTDAGPTKFACGTEPHAQVRDALVRPVVVVVDVEDPVKLGRVKVSIQGLLEGEKAVLPWALPKTSSPAQGANMRSPM